MNVNALTRPNRVVICTVHDLIPYSGVAAMYAREQVAVFYLPDNPKSVFAIANFDPIGKANVLSRGILGDKDGVLVVASPLYKQHFDLTTGQCLEEPDVFLKTYKIEIQQNDVAIFG